MPSRRESQQAADLSALLEGLCETDIEFIVVGGLSAVIQGAPVTTFDLDIVHRQTEENILKLKRDSRDPKDRERLPVYEETLKLIRDKNGT